MSTRHSEARAHAEGLLAGLAEAPAFDAHVHLGFMTNARQVAKDAASRGLALFANTVLPQEYLKLRTEFDGCENVALGVGAHPWWVADGRASEDDVGRTVELAREALWVGEIGLDFSPRHPNHDRQLQALRAICAVTGEAGGKVMSLHAVRSADVVLDVLEETRCIETCVPILHWFSGSTETLWRAVRLGVRFSVNEMQASTRRAREQLRLIPDELILFETDLPPNEDVAFCASKIEASLAHARELTTAIRSREGAAGGR